MRSILAAFCFLAAAAPVFAAAGTADPAVAEVIRRADDAFARADAAGDVSAAMEAYAEDVVFFPSGGGAVYGRTALRRWFERRASARRGAREQVETASLDACGDLAVETGAIAVEDTSGGAALRTPRFAVWKRQANGAWKIEKEMWGGSGPAVPPAALAASPAGAPPPSSAAASMPPAPAAAPAAAVEVPEPTRLAPPTDVVPIPDPRGLSDGYVRTVGDRLRSRAAKIRALEPKGGEALRAAISRADRDLQSVIRDVGWVDVGRFGVAVSCDAAFIVAQSGDAALIRSAVPWMKDLETNPEGAACYQPALEAYRKLPPK